MTGSLSRYRARSGHGKRFLESAPQPGNPLGEDLDTRCTGSRIGRAGPINAAAGSLLLDPHLDPPRHRHPVHDPRCVVDHPELPHHRHSGTAMLHRHYAHLGAKAKVLPDALGRVRPAGG
ncbi:MAG TPA: hypothetical protein VKE74_12425 [Gemmataceae bacterium]|nr:hypothetical protein [Gemmataceae bacterium]